MNQSSHAKICFDKQKTNNIAKKGKEEPPLSGCSSGCALAQFEIRIQHGEIVLCIEMTSQRSIPPC